MHNLRLYLYSFCIAIILPQLQACAPVLVAGAATGVSLISDRRAGNVIIEDQSIEMRASNALHADPVFTDETHISVTSFNGIVLVTGQVQNEQQRQHAINLIRQSGDIKSLHNELTLGKAIDFPARNHDIWLTSKIKKALLVNEEVSTFQVKVVSENSQVYLMGIVTRAEAQAAAQTAQQVEGVRGVIKVFEYLD